MDDVVVRIFGDTPLELSGRSILRVWEPGAIQAFMLRGMTMAQAQKAAFDRGYLLEEHHVENLVVTVGKGMVAAWAIDDETTGLTYHAIGTSATAPVIGNTALGTESARKIFTYRGYTGNIVTLSVFYTAAESTYNIKEAGVFGGAAASATAGSGTLFSHYLQSYDNSGGLKDLTFDYELTIG